MLSCCNFYRKPVFPALAIGSMVMAGLLSTVASSAVSANTITYGISNINGGDGTGAVGLNANFVFNVSAGQIAVTINNTTTNTASDGEEIYGLSFDLTNAAGNAVSVASAPSYTLSHGTEVSISQANNHADWLITNTTNVTAATMNKPWVVSGSGNQLSMHVGAGTPNDLVIAPPPNPEDYGNAGGLNSVNRHNPSLLSGVTFNLAIPNAIVGESISNVLTAYGTGPDYVGATEIYSGNSAPEPTTLSLLAIPAIGLLLRKKSRSLNAQPFLSRVTA